MRPRCLVTVHQPQYLPYIGLLAKIDAADACVFFDTADYQKGYFDNRNRVMTKNGPVWLTVPVNYKTRTPIMQIPIAQYAWVRKHLQTLRQAYGKSPFFEPYFTEFSGILTDWPFSSISELAEATTRWLMRSFDIKTVLRRASSFEDDSGISSRDRLIGLVKNNGGNAYLAGPSWSHYLTREDVGEFNRQDIVFFESQVFDVSYEAFNGHFPNPSAIDLLFSKGPEGITIIRKAIRTQEVQYEQQAFSDRIA